MVNEPKRNSIQRIFINIYNQMFCFDKAYSLKCLSSDKQGFCCGSRRQLTWERSLVSMNTHTYVCAHICTQMAHRPVTHRHQLNTL